jgi:rhamnulokinase
MNATIDFVAVDLGASSGRLVVGRWDGTRVVLEELHRFPNGGVSTGDGVYWDVLRLWGDIGAGLEKYCARHGRGPASISVDTWGVDFALLDSRGHLVANPHHYRDPRTLGVPGRLYHRVPHAEVFARTGVQSLSFNTLVQLFQMEASNDPRLDAAETLVMMPDLFHFWLSGETAVEYTIASTTEMLDCRRRDWARDLLSALGIPTRLLGAVVPPGTVLADLRSDVARRCGARARIPVIAGASHDTASAIAAIPGLDADSVYISSGTWSLMGVELDQPITSGEVLSRGFTNEGGVGGTIRLLRNIAGLWLLQECVRQWAREGRERDWDSLVRLARAAPPLVSIVDPDADAFLAPDDMPKAIRTFCRDTGQPEPVDEGALARCCLESLALKCRWVLESLRSVTGRGLGTIRIVGGGSRNQLLCQLTADACQSHVVAGPVEASALGNVIVQAMATGHLDGLASARASVAASCEIATYEPAGDDRWDGAYERLRGLVESRQRT